LTTRPFLHFGIVLSTLDLAAGGLETLARGLTRGLVERGHRVTTIGGHWLSAAAPAAAGESGAENLRVACPPLSGALGRRLRRVRPGWALRLQSRTFILGCRLTPSVFRRILECSVTLTFLELETVAVAHWRAAAGRPNISYFPGVIRWKDLRRDESALRLAASETLAAAFRGRESLSIDGVLYPGVQTIDPMARVQHNGLTRILFVGRLESNKGVTTLLEVARHAADRGIALELRLAGEGPMRDEIMRHAADLGGAARILCLGSLSAEEVRQELAAADLFLFPSHYESFGIAVLEALAAGVPVVCSDLPALREVAGSAAIFVASADMAGWIAAVDRVRADLALRARLSEQGRLRARRFTWGKALDILEAHAYRLIDKTPHDTRSR
jgi:glycosyltransferase involved in cell wall biosynthesis